MSKEEILKVQTCVLKVNIHCDGCKQKVKKILQRIEGVFTTHIDAEHGKVTVSGNVDPSVLIKKLAKSGKHAELWGAKKPNNNGHHQNHLANQLKNMQIDNAKGGGGHNNNKGGQKGNNNNNHPQQQQQHQPKGGQQPQLPQLTPQQLQQLQQHMKGFQDLRLPLPQQLKMPNQPQQQQQNQKTVKFALPPEYECLSDEYDDDEFDYEDLEDDEEFYDEIMDEPPHPGNKMKPMMGNGPQELSNMMMNGMNPAQFMNPQKDAPNGGVNGKRGGPGNEALPLYINMGGAAEGKNGNGGKKGGGGGGNNGGNQNQGGKNGGGTRQNGNNGGGGNNNKNGNGGRGNGNNVQVNGGKKGNNGGGGMNDGFLVGGPHGNMGQLDNLNLPMGQMGNLPMGPMGKIPAVQGLPAAATMGGAVAGAGAGAGARGVNGYFHGAGPDAMPGNPYQQQQQQQQQQQYLAAVMNQQQRAMANESLQPMMYARPPPAVNYVPQHPYPPYPYPSPYPYPYPYPYPPQNGPDPYSSFFSDENTSSCNVM